jgi:hypothetical protein
MPLSSNLTGYLYLIDLVLELGKQWLELALPKQQHGREQNSEPDERETGEDLVRAGALYHHLTQHPKFPAQRCYSHIRREEKETENLKMQPIPQQVSDRGSTQVELFPVEKPLISADLLSRAPERPGFLE